MLWFEKIHQEALRCSREYKRTEFALIQAIGRVDGKKVYRKMGYASLFDYSVKALGLSEGNAYAFINVSRKSIRIPEIAKAIESGTLSVSKAKRFLGVIKPETAKDWIAKAETLPQRELEREVARANPKFAVVEKIRPIASNRLKLECGINESLEQKLERVKALLSQKHRRVCNLEEALEAMATCYLQKHDILERPRTENQMVTIVSKPSRVVPARVRQEIYRRDKGSCAYQDSQGHRCGSQHFLDIHHIKPWSHGGQHESENLVLLCKGHHRVAHDGKAISPRG